MPVIFVKILLLLFGILALDGEPSAVLSVAAVLSALTLTAFNQYLGFKRFTAVSSAVYFAASFFYPSFMPFMPLFCFDLFMGSWKAEAALVFIPIIKQITSRQPVTDTFFMLLLLILAFFAQYICKKAERLTEENKRIRDDSSELNRMLIDKNKNLTEKQNYEIHLATLKERNRIAREIHDNVGHILSRSILQTGALHSLNKDERLSEHLTGLKETLSLAMDSIRNSVHGLRDESVDLYASIRMMTEQLHYDTTVDYDVTEDLPNDIKYCFLAVLKESLTNISRHSDASRIKISVQEHPALYQLLIHDNGTKKTPQGRGGMGLSNMEERVSAFNGNFSVAYQNGFRIFITIPKQEDSIHGN